MMFDNKKPIVTINLTPLVDVSLVLVVIFMATAPMFMQSGIIVTSSGDKNKPTAPAPGPEAKNIVVRLTAGQLLLNDQKVTETELPPLLQRLFVETRSTRVIINPDRDVRHGQVVRIMDLAKQCGAGSLVIYGKAQPVVPVAVPPAVDKE